MIDPAVELNARVLHRADLTQRLAVVRVAPEGWELPLFEAGQWATLGLPEEGAPKLLKRVYSIASAPGVGHLEFYIQLVKEGGFTTRLWPLDAGDRLWLSPKIGGFFTLGAVPPDSSVLFIGTGTGLAPFVSMVRAAGGAPRWRRCVLAHGARDVSELAYRDELVELERRDPRFRYVPTVTRETPGSAWTGARGRVQALLDGAGFAGEPLDPARTHVFLCGNPEMIDDLERRLAPLGFRHHTPQHPGNLHFERYW